MAVWAGKGGKEGGAGLAAARLPLMASQEMLQKMTGGGVQEEDYPSPWRSRPHSALS